MNAAEVKELEALAVKLEQCGDERQDGSQYLFYGARDELRRILARHSGGEAAESEKPSSGVLLAPGSTFVGNMSCLCREIPCVCHRLKVSP